MVAGPGSGKTTTSVAKALRILSIPGRSLVMVTFTKEGADEMRRRLDAAQAKAGGQPFGENRLLIGTFHSIALKHLFKHRKREKLLSPVQQNIFLQEAIKPYAADAEASNAIREEFESYMYAIDRDKMDLSSAAMAVIQRYSERLVSSRVTDLYTVMRDCALFCHDGTIPPLPFTDMLVDEGQDTDQLQKVWIFAHATAGTNVTIVGDDDQSIYEWRQALGYAGMRSFLETFNAREIKLGENFRSREEILSHAVILIQHNVNRLDKDLVATRGAGGRICSYHTASTESQCEELADLISRNPETHKNAAVLARQNRSLNELEFALSALGISYVRIGKSIWDNPHVANYLCLLQSLLDGSPVGIFGCLGMVGLDDAVKTELLHSMKGNANGFMGGEVPQLNAATATDHALLKEFSGSCLYWRRQLQEGSVNEVAMDVGEWIASKQRSTRARETIRSAASILSRLRGKLSARLYFIGNNKKSASDAPLTLMTMHGSKGLEFETVHVIDANKPEDGSDLVHEEAERRLMYVALTRAKDRCFVWYSGAPHPTLREAQLPLLHNFEDLVTLSGE